MAHEPRHISFLGREGVTKHYGIATRGPAPDPALAAAVRALAEPGVPGFTIAHDAQSAGLGLVYWWANDNEIHARFYASPLDDPGALTPYTGAGMSCVWELEVIDFERRAWLEDVLIGEDVVGVSGARAGPGGRLMGVARLRLPPRPLGHPQPPAGRHADPAARVGGVPGDLGTPSRCSTATATTTTSRRRLRGLLAAPLRRRRTDLWRIWWSSTARPGRLDPPVEGRFSADGTAALRDRRRPRRRAAAHALRLVGDHADSARWEQSFSFDEGETWVHNWTMLLTRAE